MIRLVAALLLAFVVNTDLRAETPDEWVKLGARVHGGFGSFIAVGIKIGMDAIQRLGAEPRTLAVIYYDNPEAPCACFADGIAIATLASVGQRSLTIAAESAPPAALAVVVIKPKGGGPGVKYTIPKSALPKLGSMNKDLQPRQRYDAVMAADDLFTVEPAQ